VLTIPAEALLEVDGRDATVFVLDAAGSAALRRRVQVLWLDGGVAAVRGEVDVTSRVVIAGGSRLSDGARVTMTPAGVP
jgi:multidrug efflux pump subunit AcrA (membrane-fusion protein)